MLSSKVFTLFFRRFPAFLDDSLTCPQHLRFVGWVTGFIHNRVLTLLLFEYSLFVLTPHFPYLTNAQKDPTVNMIKSYSRVTLLRGAGQEQGDALAAWWSSVGVDLPTRHFLRASDPDQISEVGRGRLLVKPPRVATVMRSRNRHCRESIRCAIEASIPNGSRCPHSLLWVRVTQDGHMWERKVRILRFNSGVKFNGKPIKAGRWGVVGGANVILPGDNTPVSTIYACQIEHFYQACLSPMNRTDTILLVRARPYPVTHTNINGISTFKYKDSGNQDVLPHIPPLQYILFKHFQHMGHTMPDEGDANARRFISLP